jgi:multidrug efflux system membrane fusion protein
MHVRYVRAALLAAGLLGCQARAAAEPRSLAVVRAEPLRAPTAAPDNRYSGVVRANKQVELDFKVAGYVAALGHPRGIRERTLQEGDRVDAGAVLATVDPADYAARVATARAAVVEAQAAESQALRDRKRSDSLVASGALAAVDLENRSSAFDVASARLARAEATLHEAELALADSTLRAPFAGVILSKLVDLGAFVTARSPAFVLADDTAMKVVFGVPDAVMESLRVGDPATVQFPSLGRHVTAQVSRISPAADPRSRSFEVEVTLGGQADIVKVGLSATVILDGAVRKTPAGALVPLRSIVARTVDGDLSVYVVDGEATEGVGRATAHIRPIHITQIVGDDAVVTGLTLQDRVVTLGAPLLHDGDIVRLTP